jgi:hypothetical protein
MPIFIEFDVLFAAKAAGLLVATEVAPTIESVGAISVATNN